MMLSHKIRIYPNQRQAAYFRRACGASRWAYNWGLMKWREWYETSRWLGQKCTCSGYNLANLLTVYKPYIRDENGHPWLTDIHSNVTGRALLDVEKAYKRHWRDGAGWPKYKKKGRSTDSFYVHAREARKVSGKYCTIPPIKHCGRVRMAEELRFDGKIMGATVSRQADRWFIAFQVDVMDYQPKSAQQRGGVVGIDLGIKTPLALSTGEYIKSPRPLEQYDKHLRRLQKQLSHKKKGSANYRKLAARVAKLHYRVACQRQNWQHETTTAIAARFDTVCVEDLHVKGMQSNGPKGTVEQPRPRRAPGVKGQMQTRHRNMADIGWGEIRRQLAYKTELRGGQMVVVDRYFPSSKTCSRCGWKDENQSLADRVFACPSCGLTLDRDLNAAINIEQCGTAMCAGTGGDVPAKASGEAGLPASVNEEQNGI